MRNGQESWSIVDVLDVVVPCVERVHRSQQHGWGVLWCEWIVGWSCQEVLESVVGGCHHTL